MREFEELKAGILSILNEKGNPIGVGFLIANNLGVTCRHVISDIVSSSSSGREIEVEFPFLDPKNKYRAQVIFWEDGKEIDLSGIKLLDAMPPGGKALHLADVENATGHEFITYGFPSDHNDGVWAQGVLMSEIAKSGWIQLEDTKAQGIRIQEGFSGAPVWDKQLGGVVGIIVAAKKDETEKMAFCIPAKALLARPEFEDLITVPQTFRLN